MTTRRVGVLVVTLASLGVFALAQDDEVALRRWAAPPYWTPPAPAVPGLGRDPGIMQTTAQRMTAQAQSLPSQPLPFTAVTPCRVADTRGNGFTGAYGPPSLLASSTRNFPIGGQCVIPASAVAVSFNFTVLNGTQSGDLRFYPTGGAMPLVSTINWKATTGALANAAVVPLGTSGSVTVKNDSIAAVDLIIDVNGYYGPSSVVTSLNALSGDVTLAPGSNLTITPSGNTLTIDGPTALPPSGPAGGSLAGTYPNPEIAAGAVGGRHLADATVVRSLNGAQDAVTIQGSGGITVGTVGSTVTVGVPSGALPTPDLARVAVLNWWGKAYSGGSYGFNWPAGVAFDGTHLWVVNWTGQSVTELNASDGSWVQTLSGGSYGFSGALGVAFDGAHLWVSNNGGNSVTEINASDGSWVQTLSGGSYGFDAPYGVAFDGTHIWVTNQSGNSVTEINASDGGWVQTLSGGSYGLNAPIGVAFDGTHVWVANNGGNTVTEINASDGGWVQTLSGGSYGFNGPFGVTCDGAHVWVTNAYANAVTEINALSGSWVQTLSGGSYGFSDPAGMAFDGTHLWVANYNGNSVTELNTSDGSWVQTLSGGSYGFNLPVFVAFDGTHIWVTNFNGGSVTEVLVR